MESDPGTRTDATENPRGHSEKEPTLLVIVGPTSSGKTRLSLLLAESLNAEILSADSRQIYRYLDVGTAKPSKNDRARIPHHFVDILDPAEEFSAGEFGKQARAVLADMYQRGKRGILVGGSGLYVKAVVDGLFEGPGKNEEVRKEFEEELARKGLPALLEKLRSVDAAAARVMEAEPKARRVIRALEVFHTTGKPISAHHAEHRKSVLEHVTMVAPLWDRKTLHNRIEQRVDWMMNNGFLEEIELLESKGYRSTLNSLNTVGYKELFEYRRGSIGLEKAVGLIRKNTKRFAKRQLTWFRREERVRWLAVRSEQELDVLAGRILEML